MARTEKNSLNTKKTVTLQEKHYTTLATHTAHRLPSQRQELFFGYLRPKVQPRLIVPKHYTSISLKKKCPTTPRNFLYKTITPA